MIHQNTPADGRSSGQPWWPIVALALIAGGVLSPALAAPSTSVDVQSSAGWPSSTTDSIGNESGTSKRTASGAQQGASSLAVTSSGAGVDFNGVTGNASGRSSAWAEFGTLHASSAADASSLPTSGGSFIHANASGAATATFSDRITAFDRTRGANDTITLHIDMTLDWLGGVGGTGGTDDNRGLTSLVYANYNIFGFGGGTHSHSEQLAGSFHLVQDKNDPALTITVKNGSVLEVFGQLQTQVQAGVGGWSDVAVTAFASANAEHTARLVVWGDASLTALGDSGHNYLASAVPEPATWALLTGGLLVVGRLRRRVRH